MRILFDHQIFGSQKIGGISRYFSEIYKNLPPEISKEVSIRYTDNVYFRKICGRHDLQYSYNPRENFLKGIEFKGKGRLFNLIKTAIPGKYVEPSVINRQISIDYLKKKEFDVFHPTYYNDYFLEYLDNKPFVLTIHDMVHELYPEFYSSTDELDFVQSKAQLARKASRIIAVSENTRKDVINILGIDENKISVIHHAVPGFNDIKKAPAGLPKRYLLYVGDRAPEYKNFKFMARALAPLLKKINDLFVICSGIAFNQKEINFLSHLEVLDRFKTMFVPEESLYSIYKNAISLIYPSYYEGFGLPILEAFAAGCPVILARSSCFPEIAADAALYFEPKEMAELREQLMIVLKDDKTRQTLLERGFERSKLFSWEISARKTLKVYLSVI